MESGTDDNGGLIRVLRQVINILTQFESRCDGHLGLIKAVQHRVGLNKRDSRLKHSALYREGAMVRRFEEEEIDQMLAWTLSDTPRQQRPHRLYLLEK